ncbi:universal stress protein [Streptomyces sp. NPDC057743]|uniref:universal stress protein n=1 Tax=Streptomyces sp. NPDC057743 TaxID=3346236 RepID=UPI0036C9397A
MTRPVVVGVDGSPAGLAAADWGAREALLRDLPLRLVHAWEWQPGDHDPSASVEGARLWSEGVAQKVTEQLRRRYPDLDVWATRIIGPPRDVLCRAAKDAEVLVIGTVSAGRLAGFLLGSVATAVVARAAAPVVLVRAGAQEGEAASESGAEPPAPRPPARADAPVVLGLDLSHPGDAVITFAFQAAAVRAAPLVVVHGWNPLPYSVYGLGARLTFGADLGAKRRESVSRTLQPWRERYPGVEVSTQAVVGEPARHLLDAAARAALVVLGRHRRTKLPSPPHIGHITHAVLHHCPAPVAVVPHG